MVGTHGGVRCDLSLTLLDFRSDQSLEEYTNTPRESNHRSITGALVISPSYLHGFCLISLEIRVYRWVRQRVSVVTPRLS